MLAFCQNIYFAVKARKFFSCGLPEMSGGSLRDDFSSGPKNLEERGSGTAWALLLLLGIFAAGYLVIALAQAHQARWQVQTAADFGALAAATAWRTGFDPCPVALETVARNRAELTTCQFGPNGQMKVTATIRINLIGPHHLSAHSIAGPRPMLQ